MREESRELTDLELESYSAGGQKGQLVVNKDGVLPGQGLWSRTKRFFGFSGTRSTSTNPPASAPKTCGPNGCN